MTSLLQRLSDDNPKQQGESFEVIESNFEAEVMMLLFSRPRFSDVENIPVLNCTVLNYGIDEHFSSDIPKGERKFILQGRLETAIRRFEPRLKNVSFTVANEGVAGMIFLIDAHYQNKPVHYKLIWDDAISRFYLSE